MLLLYTDYIEKWDEIAAIFSHEAVMKGSFDKYAEGAKEERHSRSGRCVSGGDRRLARMWRRISPCGIVIERRGVELRRADDD